MCEHAITATSYKLKLILCDQQNDSISGKCYQWIRGPKILVTVCWHQCIICSVFAY